MLAIGLAVGCKSTLTVNNRSAPKDLKPVPLPGAGYTGSAFAELEYGVPEEVYSEEFDIARADIFADVFIEEFYVTGDAEITVHIYLGLEPGEAGLDNPDVNRLLTTVTITESGEHHPVAISNPGLLREGLKQGRFYVKVNADILANPTSPADPQLGVLRITDIYFNAFLERETSGLFSFFYMF